MQNRGALEEFLVKNAPLISTKNVLNQAAVICSAEPGCPVVYATKVVESHTGYDHSELMGKNMSLLQGPESSEQAIEMFRFLMKSPQVGTVVIRNYRRDGQAFWNRVALAPIYGCGFN